jgi:hypothetical protein
LAKVEDAKCTEKIQNIGGELKAFAIGTQKGIHHRGHREHRENLKMGIKPIHDRHSREACPRMLESRGGNPENKRSLKGVFWNMEFEI